MDREKELALITECLELMKGDKPVLTDEETLIPVAEYCDETLFEKERALLRRSMNLIAHSSQIASPGDFITRELLGTPVLLVRDKDGSARAFMNVCRHRGATVEPRERGNCRRFVCPYHAWTYETNGALAVVRHKEGFPTLDLENTRLVDLACFEGGGFIWVCPDPGIKGWTPDAKTSALVEEFERLGCADCKVYDSETRVWKANWKLIVDGGLEAYHFRVAHRNTIGGFFTDNISTFEMLGDHIRTVLPRLSLVELAAQPQSEWDIRKHTHLVYGVFPNATVLMQERHFELILMTPMSVDETRIEIATVVPKPRAGGYSEKAERFWAANHAFTKTTLNEDFEIGEQIQRGVRSGANEFYRFARFEGALTQWHRLFDAKLSCSS